MSSMNSPMTMAHSDVKISRSRLKINNSHLTSLSAGYLYPIYCAEVIPGDTCKMDLSFLTRMNTPIHPTMGDAYQDIAFFFVPNRIVWNDFKAFMGESPEDPYLNPIEYKIPVLRATHQLEGGEGEVTLPFHSVLDYIGLPAGNNFYEFNALPIRGFCAIWNEWWRDQNLQYSIDFPKTSQDFNLENAGVARPGSATPENFGWSSEALAYWNGNDDDYYIRSTAYGGVLPPVSKFHDLFTSATLQAQKGDPVPIPVTSFNSDWLPVMARNPLVFDDDSLTSMQPVSYGIIPDSQNNESLTLLSNGQTGVDGYALGYSQDSYFSSQGEITPVNLWAKGATVDASSYATINDLRYAFALQKYLELDNFGTRYREIIYNHFKVLSPDASMQVPEFLGGRTIRIGMQQVVQNSATNDVSPQGNLAAYSMTGDKLDSFFTKSFTEHGFIIGVTCIRSVPIYEQNAPKYFLYREKLDLFSPEFGQIGDQPIRVPELWNDEANFEAGGSVPEYFDQYFGFSEAWYQYRTAINHISGQMRSNHPDSLAYWHYGEYYKSQPYLNDEFIRQKRTPIGKTLAGGDKFGQDQFIMDMIFKPTWVRPVPMFSSGWYGGRL